jgi:flagellar motor protein MotB
MKPGLGPCMSKVQVPARPEKPPILNLTERAGYRFDTGKYELSPQFRDQLETEVVPQLIKLGQEYKANVVEVVGHTDSVAIRGRNSSLDGGLLPYLSGSGANAEVADNVGLGMMRASSVVRALRESPALKDRGFVFLAMSAGQTIAPNDQPVGEEKGPAVGDDSRRRVEIRLRRPLSSP